MDGHHGPRSDEGTQRIETFSDGVFAIAITLLIIQIKVPDTGNGRSLADGLTHLWPSYGAYALSFAMIGIYWANHHFFFKLFHATDHAFLLLNVFLLMWIAFLPFPTAVLGQHLDNAGERHTAVTLYAAGLLAPAFAWLSMWVYGIWRRLVDERLAPGYVRFLTFQYLASNTLYAAAIAVSLFSAWAGLAICVGLTLAYLLPPRVPRYVD